MRVWARNVEASCPVSVARRSGQSSRQGIPPVPDGVALVWEVDVIVTVPNAVVVPPEILLTVNTALAVVRRLSRHEPGSNKRCRAPLIAIAPWNIDQGTSLVAGRRNAIELLRLGGPTCGVTIWSSPRRGNTAPNCTAKCRWVASPGASGGDHQRVRRKRSRGQRRH